MGLYLKLLRQMSGEQEKGILSVSGKKMFVNCFDAIFESIGIWKLGKVSGCLKVTLSSNLSLTTSHRSFPFSIKPKPFHSIHRASTHAHISSNRRNSVKQTEFREIL